METRYTLDRPSVREELDAPILFRQSRDDRDDRRVQNLGDYRRGDQSIIRRDLGDGGPPRSETSREVALFPSDGRPHEYFLPGERISREVITADIGRYLGPEATCRAFVNREARIIPAFRLKPLRLTEF
jgi:hypothetical protein